MAGFNVNTVTVALGDPAGNDKQLFALQAPSDAHGGGLTIVDASIVNGAATTSGTSFSLALHRYSNEGTPAVNGTIAAAIGGTATPWAAGVPQNFTLDADYTFVDAGEWVVLQYNEQTAGNPTNATATIHYVMGR